MIILPLPTLVMDVLIALNISAAIIILLMALHLHTPVQFSTFPSVLLVTTLFRLAISISTTRLILVQGDAGEIVKTFGEVVIGGNLVVGLVIFLIITVVQFLVITKGADRVAEVGARFSLDGMPGKQMSVDADVRSGMMDQVDASTARQNLEREAKLFGAMDGAMKFVKGDAVAGLVITAINLIGGISIGLLQLDMQFEEALSLYALMTIGDGLVAQIPALLISVAAGTIVTRVVEPKGSDLGSEISRQVTANSRTVICSGLVIAAFGFVPGFPTLIFLVVGFTMSASVYVHIRRIGKAKVDELKDWVVLEKAHIQYCQEQLARTRRRETVRLVLPKSITTCSPYVFKETFASVKSNLEQNFGVPTGYWRFEISQTDEVGYEIHIHQDKVVAGDIRPDCVFVKSNASYLSVLKIPHTVNYGTNEGALVPNEHRETLKTEGIHFSDIAEQILIHLTTACVENLARFAGVQSVSDLLESLSKVNDVLISDVRENLSNAQVSTTFQQLLEERVPILSQIRILETAMEVAAKRADSSFILQKVRVAISDILSSRYAPKGFMPAIVLAPTLENFIREGFRNTEEESFLVLDPKLSMKIVDRARSLMGEGHIRETDPVLLTQQDIRRPVRNLLTEHGLYVPVLAYQEITPATIIYPIGFVTNE
ncbi:flagellar biosynthesis protein FlhA [uncultured Tateyamaria sp.]|uniref:flagellar biosynthesis protein FlhA n=1 Tax=uncultured Tateyamaria sp. TaxID=455651 RepID=UPI002601E37D|nr:flagellar biosynthesis protein FlhA [uncultured Tateyamaria sp.]